MKIIHKSKGTARATNKKPARKDATLTTKNRISEVVYETAKDLLDAGAITQTTMRDFEALRLPSVPRYTPNQIKAIRQSCNASQAVFAAYMNTSPSSLRKWETGARKPDNIALKLLSLVDKKGLEALI
jgi:putative transcriptional regulator